MTDVAWIDGAISGARPRAVSALLRYFRDLDIAEEAFQEACLRALKTWPVKGPPRDPTAWLVLVGRNAALDGARRRARDRPLPDEAAISELEDAEVSLVERLDEAHSRDDILRLLFVCCHPDLPDTQQIGLALRIVSGLKRSKRSPRRSWSARRPWSSASPEPRRGWRRRGSRSRPPTRSIAPSVSPRSRP